MELARDLPSRFQDKLFLGDISLEALCYKTTQGLECRGMPLIRCSWPLCTTESMHVAKALA